MEGTEALGDKHMGTTRDLNEELIQRDEDLETDLAELKNWILEDIRSGYGDLRSY
jgi:hypothetical protein